MNTNILIVVPNYWGKGLTVKAAWAKVREASGRPKSYFTRSGEWVEWVVHPDSYCEEVFGNIVHPKGHPPSRIAWGKAVKVAD